MERDALDIHTEKDGSLIIKTTDEKTKDILKEVVKLLSSPTEQREFDRIERITTKLRAVWEQKQNSDMRFYQLLEMLMPRHGEDFFYKEDDLIEKALDRELQKVKKEPNYNE